MCGSASGTCTQFLLANALLPALLVAVATSAGIVHEVVVVLVMVYVYMCMVIIMHGWDDMGLYLLSSQRQRV